MSLINESRKAGTKRLHITHQRHYSLIYSIIRYITSPAPILPLELLSRANTVADNAWLFAARTFMLSHIFKVTFSDHCLTGF